jgi:hypothetical protein
VNTAGVRQQPRATDALPLSVGLGVLIAIVVPLAPMIGLAMIGLTWTIAVFSYVPRDFRIAAPLFLLLLIPADHINGLTGPAQGFLLLVSTAVLAGYSFIRLPFPGLQKDWDLLALSGVLTASTLIHSATGELRGIVLWTGACLALYWIRAEAQGGRLSSRQVCLAIVAAGSISGLMAAVEFLGVLSLRSLIPGYEPNQLEFASALGLRASGLSGHPLRLGTLTMAASLLCLTWLLDRKVRARTSAIVAAALAASLTGLVLSGARGAWLGFLVGLAVLAALRWRAVASYAAFRAIAYGMGISLFVWGSGLWTYVYERTSGVAFHAASIGQRLQALEAVLSIASRVPVTGVGFGGAANIAWIAGLKIPNLENEYLRFFLVAGLFGPCVLMLIGIRRVRSLLGSTRTVIGTSMLVTLAAVFANIATYNLFSWSSGPLLFFALCTVASNESSRTQ